MINITLFGYGGMGRAIEAAADVRADMSVNRIFDFDGSAVYCAREGKALSDEAVIDFSHYTMHDEALKYALEKNIPIVVGTTGLSDEQISNMQEAAEHIPVLYSTNYSYGILIMNHLIREANKYLSEWDVELAETHHSKKRTLQAAPQRQGSQF